MTASGAVEDDEESSAKAPLPVLGGRLEYRITPKLSMILAGDVFLFKTDNKTGSLGDGFLLFEHRTFDHFSFGAGFSRVALDLEIDDRETTELLEWQSVSPSVHVFRNAIWSLTTRR